MTVILQFEAQRVFAPWGEGSEVAVLRAHESGGVTTMTRFFKGAAGRWHSHPGGEELYVISGHISVDSKELRAGDYLYTPPGAAHAVRAHEETLLFLVHPLLPDYSVEAPPVG